MSNMSSSPLQPSLPVATATTGTATKSYIPLATYQPAFANITPTETSFPIPNDVMGILAAAETLSIRQHVKLLPKQCCVS